MKKFIAIIAVMAIVVIPLMGCGGEDNPPNDMQRNARIFGEIVAVDGNRITMNELTFGGGMVGGQGGRVVMSGGQQDGEPGERVMIVRDEDEYIEEILLCEDEYSEIEYRDDDGNLVEPIIGDDAEINRSSLVRIEGADAETDRIRVGGQGEDGQQMTFVGEQLPPFERAGHATSVVVPRSMMVTVGFQDDETVEVSTLGRGDIVLVIFDEEGRMDSIRLLPDARIGE